MCIYTHIVHNMATVVRQRKFKKNGTAVNAACHFGHACHRLFSPVLERSSDSPEMLRKRSFLVQS